MAPDTRDGIWVGDQYYILATAARASGRSAVLKSGDTFAVFDRTGDIAGPGEHGLYHDGTRHLSLLTLAIEHDVPLLLSSRTSVSNELFGADLTNPDLVDRGVVRLQRDLVHIFRSRFLDQGHAYERIRFVNYGQQPVRLDATLHFAADFVDIFEVRGTRRERRGTTLPARAGRATVELSYRGLDAATRRTDLRFDPPPDELTASSARYVVSLTPHQSATIEIVVSCLGAAEGEAAGFDAAFAARAERSRRLAGEYAQVSTSNEQFNGWLERSLADVRLMTTDTPYGPYPYAGVPWFSTPFGRDGIITALETLWLNPTLAAGVLRYLAATQAATSDPARDAEPGKILHETRGGEMAAIGEVPFGRYYGSVDSTPLFVMLAAEYYRRTADLAFLSEIWPNVERALDWMRNHGDVDGDGFLEYQRRTPSGLVQQGWKDSQDSVFHADGTLAEPPIALCEVQGYAYAAFRGAATIARALGHSAAVSELTSRAASLREAFERAFWLDELDTYALALDGAKQPCCVRSSNPAHCLFAGIAAPDRARRVAASLMASEMFSGWGVRTIGTAEARYNPMSYHNGSLWPHDNALAAAGLARYGAGDAVAAIAEGLFEASLHVDLQRLPELLCGFRRRVGEGPTLYPVACAPQAWSAAAVFLVLQSCLGLTIDAVEGRVYVSHARLPELLDQVTVRGLTVGRDAAVDLLFNRHGRGVGVTVLDRAGQVAVIVTA